MTSGDRVSASGLDPAWVSDLVSRALAEDLGVPGDGPHAGHDVTGEATIPAEQVGTADIVARAPGILAGLPVALAVFGSPDIEIQVSCPRWNGYATASPTSPFR